MTAANGESSGAPLQDSPSSGRQEPPVNIRPALVNGGWLNRLLGRRAKIIGTHELYQDWPNLSTHAVRRILKALVACGDAGCTEGELPALSDMPGSVLEPALGQLGQDHLVSHRIIEYRGLLGLYSRTRIRYTITDAGREYLGSDGWRGRR